MLSSENIFAIYRTCCYLGQQRKNPVHQYPVYPKASDHYYLLFFAMIQNVWVARIWGLQKHLGKIKKCLILLFLPRHSLLATAGEVILGYTFDLPFVFSVRVLNFSFPPPAPENKIKEQPFLKEPTQEPTEPVVSSKQAVKKDSFRHQIPMLSLENLRTSVCFCYLRSCRTELERRL